MSFVRIEGNIVFRAYQNGDGLWIGVCDALGISAEGESWGALLQAIDETMNLMFRDLFSRRELDRFLRARGWTAIHRRPAKQTSRVKFDVPFRVTPVAPDESGHRVYS